MLKIRLLSYVFVGFLFVFPTIKADFEDETENIWAVLVAGSNGFWNYRHQADVCHAWHVLVDHGVSPDRIITMMYDDIAHARSNPYPGKLFNSPAMKDVYQGVRIDYRGNEVTPANFKAVLLGNEEAVEGKKVLKSTSKDKVFIYFSDHGAFGLIAFPYGAYGGDILTVKELTQTLQKMHVKRMYGEMTFYLEACESGSMFDQKIAQQMNVFAVTAANADESSWACYCNTQIRGLEYTCLGDLFSVNWIEDSDRQLFLGNETIGQQLNLVKRLTDSSHVKWFGNLRIMTENLSEFQGKAKSQNAQIMEEKNSTLYSPANFKRYPSRDVPIRSMGPKTATNEKQRAYVDMQMDRIGRALSKLVPQNAQNNQPFVVDKITQMDCHHEVMHTFNKFCFNFSKSPYVLKYAKTLANLCEQRAHTAQIVAILKDQCANLEETEAH